MDTNTHNAIVGMQRRVDASRQLVRNYRALVNNAVQAPTLVAFTEAEARRELSRWENRLRWSEAGLIRLHEAYLRSVQKAWREVHGERG